MRRTIICALFALVLVGCDNGPKSARGFTLPEGDEALGRQVFLDHKCQSCHRVDGLDRQHEEALPELSIALGGKTTRIASYGELVTSIINPSHKLAKGYPEELVSDDGLSKMRNYNQMLTVDELINLVSFLQAQYELEETPSTPYRPYIYR